MGLKGVQPNFKFILYCFIGYFIFTDCLFLVLASTTTTKRNDDIIKSDQCCTTETTKMMSSARPDMNKEVFSFTQNFLSKRAGRGVDMKTLLTNYSLICPMQDACGVDIDNKFLFPDFPDEIYQTITEEISYITGCERCSCDRSCISRGNCCPGTHFGYVDHSCINTILYPNTTKQLNCMVETCLDRYNENKTINELCRESLEPCTGKESKLFYKNKYCGECNKELDCIPWNLIVECLNGDEFEKKMGSFSSLIDIKKALDANRCKIRFRPLNEFAYIHQNTAEDSLSTVNIDRCNVSGFWEIYDEDIDWACTHFKTPYKQFKNVFCYICNPSQANMQEVSLIDRCPYTWNTTWSEIYRACTLFPATNRLAPFKNIYCYLCNQGHKFLYEDNEYSLQYAEEENTQMLQTRLDMAIVFFGENNIQDFVTFVGNLTDEHFEDVEQNTTPHKATQLNYDASDMDDIVTDYTVVCGAKTFCNVNTNRNNTDKLYGNPVCKNCSCESTCAENESCCPDILFTREPYSCFKPRMFSSFYKYNKREELKWTQVIRSNSLKYLFKTIDICLNDYITTSATEKCSFEHDMSDRLYGIPVSTETGMTYKNVYCYTCNNNNSVITLQFQAECATYIEHKLFTSVERLLKAIKLYCEGVSFVPVRNKECQNAFDSEKAALRGGEKFIRRELHPTQFEFKVKVFEKIHGRERDKPVKKVFDVCNKTGLYRKENSDLVTNICETDNVNLMSLPQYRVGNLVYKNFACFLCNPEYDMSASALDNIKSICLSNTSIEWYEPDATLEELCNETDAHSRWYPYKNMYCAECNLPPWQLVEEDIKYFIEFPAAGYKYIFSLSLADFEHLDEVMEEETIPDCAHGTYDYVLVNSLASEVKSCRPLSCNNGFLLSNTTCKPILESIVRHEYDLSLSLYYLPEGSFNDPNNTGTNTTIKIKWNTLCTKVMDNISSLFGDTTKYLIKEKECLISPCGSSDDNVFFVDLNQMDKFNIHLTVLILKTQHISVVHSTLLNALNRQFKISNITDIHGQPTTILVHSKPSLMSDRNKFYPLACFNVEVFEHQEIESLKFSHYNVDAFLTCGQVKLNTSEVYVDLESNSIILKNTNVTFSVWEYKIVDKNVIICTDIYEMKTFIEPVVIITIRTDPMKSIFIVFSLVCTIVSLICLFLTFLTYCSIASLRTVAGKNVMILCISLFFSQALLQFGINSTELGIFCVAIGISVHLFWLLSFCAMNICSFHAFKVFCYNDLSNRLTDNQSGKILFLKYSLYMVGLPLCMVLATIVTNIVKTDVSDIGYGEYYCFISDFYIFIFTFITPACLLFVSNIVFFSMAFHKIRSAPHVQGRQDRNHLYICLRLFTVTGIAWPLLVIDSSLGITWFSFIVAGVNALQGVFIFVSFVLNRRVTSLLISAMVAKYGKNVLTTESKETKSSYINNKEKSAEVE